MSDLTAGLVNLKQQVDKMYEVGLSISDLRWLVAKGLALHGREVSAQGDSHRSIRCSQGFNFDSTSCVVLTPKGASFAKLVMNEAGAPLKPILSTDRNLQYSDENVASAVTSVTGETKRTPITAQKPNWDPVRRELYLQDKLVKRFRVPASNQEMILSVFEEEGWPVHIDDPLPFRQDIDPKIRLHDTIHRLNGHQTNRLLCFHGDGYGSGVLWELV